MQRLRKNIIYKNIPNIVSILGILPLCILFQPNGYQYLIPLIIYNNVMDDLDGILADQLSLKSNFGALLDNLCDAIATTLFVMVTAMQFGLICQGASLIAITAVILRVVSRMTPESETGNGSPTNELLRHMLFVLLLATIFNFNPEPVLTGLFMIHAASMLIPYKMPLMIRSLTKSTLTISLVNMTLIIAWLVPYATPIIAVVFMIAYLYSFIVSGIKHLGIRRALNHEQ